ncbi:unnamed protein product [Macrosiphum euphorbiae]|uniref:Uncharacterized protein n=2 Tax=Macrosiphum euphorbiae TaxID=13131 RepID=A0AAV0Y7Y8_9HEMI|nr:unnamed protein product [Macrosiphum euphorbiae]
MEHTVSSKTAPEDVTDNACTISFVDFFDSMYYDLMAMAKLHKMVLSPQSDPSQGHNTTQFGGTQHLSIYQLPKRSFPTFSGDITDYEGFEDLFLSILSHTPDAY